MNQRPAIKLNESYHFLVKKMIVLPGMKNQFVMQAPDGTKHLMPAKPYEKYPINVGDEVKCYVDKINCVGKVFIEPVHPFYKRGKIYSVTITEIGKLFYKRGKYRKKIFILNSRGEQTEAIPVNFEQLSTGNIQCKVLKLKKGIPVICPAS